MAALAADYVNTTHRHVFLTGKAGTGKTTFLRHIVSHTYKQTVVAAPT
ncbi:MAG: AAA family ATPase, partial [Bacteroidota bacterium]